MTSIHHTDDRFDVVIAGARVAGSSTAMLLARAGLRVLVVDPVPRGRDTLSTHALMRAGVMQLARWGVLDGLRAAGTPRIEWTTFHYAEHSTTVAIEPGDGIDGLYAPRRTVLDPLLQDAASDAGAHFAWGWSVVDLLQTPNGQVRGAILTDARGGRRVVEAGVVVGADGIRSRVARLVGARTSYSVPHATASIYGYIPGLARDRYHWFFRPGGGAGIIPTNGDMGCVFVSIPPHRLLAQRADGLERLFLDGLRRAAPALFEVVARSPSLPRLRAFPGAPSALRESAGPGWALVGDAGYFKDPLTAHGMTDALRDAELLARAIGDGLGGTQLLDDALAGYQRRRDELSRGLMDVTSRIASLEWDDEEVQQLHRELSREMKQETALIRGWEALPTAA